MFTLGSRAKAFRSISYAGTLHAVGLVLEMRDLKSFDLQCDNIELLLKCGYQKPPCSTTVDLRYSIDELESLERENLRKRDDRRKVVDFLSLAEVLRGLGSYVDKKQGRLIRISNNSAKIAAGSVKLEYEAYDGARREETFALSSIYDICVRMDKDRSEIKTPSNLWTAPHFIGAKI